jgi:uncharacterized protein YbjT (DUF2867 family)
MAPSVLITGAAGNLGSLLARHLLRGGRALRLMYHRRSIAADLLAAGQVTAVRADLSDPSTLPAAVDGVDAIVHFAGVLFRAASGTVPAAHQHAVLCQSRAGGARGGRGSHHSHLVSACRRADVGRAPGYGTIGSRADFGPREDASRGRTPVAGRCRPSALTPIVLAAPPSTDAGS